jgi:hypothetical protein
VNETVEDDAKLIVLPPFTGIESVDVFFKFLTALRGLLLPSVTGPRCKELQISARSHATVREVACQISVTCATLCVLACGPTGPRLRLD